MMKALVPLSTMLALVAIPPATAAGGRTVAGHCLAVVEGKTTLTKASCSIDLEVGGGFTMKRQYGDGEYRVVPDKAAGTAAATWTKDIDGGVRKLGTLHREGACWVADDTKLCAWSDEAEMRRNRAAPYTDFRPLVGKPVQAKCRMNECQWFRYDSARLVDHNAHEALFEIREHTWVTEHPDGDYDRPRKAEEMAQHTFYARCSRTRPSFFDAPGKKGKGEGIDFAPATDVGMTGAYTWAYVQYAAACHGLTREIVGIDGLRLGYSPDSDARTNETKIVDPKDALK